MKRTSTADGYSKKQEESLTNLYNMSFQEDIATNDEAKIELLETALSGRYSFYALGGGVTNAMRVACLEEEYLIRQGLLNPVSL